MSTYSREPGNFEVSRNVLHEFCSDYDRDCLVADLDGDRHVDLLSSGRVEVAFSLDSLLRSETLETTRPT